MTVLINEEQLAFVRIGLPQVKVGFLVFAIAWEKSPDLQNLIEIEIRLCVQYSAILKSSSYYSGQAAISSKYKLPFPLHIPRSNNVTIIT